MRCLSVTFDNGFLSEQAKLNIKNAVEITKTDHINYHLSPQKSINMFKVFFRKTGDFCSACMRGINHAIETAANDYRIPLVIKGSGRRVQYVSQIGISSSSNSAYYFRNVMRGEPNHHEYSQFYPRLNNYENSKMVELFFKLFKIPIKYVMRFTPLYIGIYDYVYEPYNKIVEILKEELNWSDKDGTIEHLDCLFHDVPFYLQTLQVEGITKDTFYNSGQIRQGIMTREEAMKVEEANLENRSPPEALNTFLEMCSIPDAQFNEHLENADPKRYVPFFEKIFTQLYSRRVLGDKK